MSIVLEGYSDYVIFFDDQHVQRYVTSFSTSAGLTGAPAEASINMLYTEAFMKIEYMTDVKIFIKNVFSGKYRLVFDGQIHGRTVNITPQGRAITFTAIDNTFWFQRVPVPFLFGTDVVLDRIVPFTWLAKGVNFEKVRPMITQGLLAFDGLNLESTLKSIFETLNQSLSIHADSSTPDENTVYQWINLANKIRVVSDIDAKLRRDSKLDIFYQGAIMDNMYVLITGLVNKLGYEIYQDIDGIIKIKEPYWGEGVLKNFVIDPAIVINMSESTNWDNSVTRVLVTGGVESSLANSATSVENLHQFMPAGVYVGNTEDNFYVDIEDAYNTTIGTTEQNYVKTGDGAISTTSGSRNNFVELALSVAGTWTALNGAPYVWGGINPATGVDCSGLVFWALTKAGFKVGRESAQGYYNLSRKLSVDQVQVGDLGFKYDTNGTICHVGIYCGQITGADGVPKYTWVEASGTEHHTGKTEHVVYTQSATTKNMRGWARFGDIISVLEGGYSGTSFPLPTGTLHKPLTRLTDLERKFGINVYETEQPLIRYGLDTAADRKLEASALMKDYSKYVYDTMNASATQASITLLGSPWLRLGFNIWLDPLGLSRFYYINSISHSGDSNGVYTTLGLIYGRSQEEFITMYNEKAGNSKNTNNFTNVTKIKPEEYSVQGSLSVITDSNIDNFKTYVDSVHSACEDRGSLPAYDSKYKDWYGEHFIRREVNFLNRWDSEFNLLELYYIQKAYYSGKTSVGKISYPSTGERNPMHAEDRYVSSFVKDVVVPWDDKNIKVPDIIASRVSNLYSIIVAADDEIKIRYKQSNPNE